MSTQATEKVERSSEKLAESAETLTGTTQRIEGSADRRTLLAADRTVFAAERTYAAWTRTGLVSLASGIGARKLLEGLVPAWMILAMGSVLVLFSAFCFAGAVWRQFDTGADTPMPNVRRLPPWLLLAINAFLAIVAITVLVAVLIGRAGP